MNDSKCLNCGAPRDARAVHCSHCGLVFAQATPAAASPVPLPVPAGLEQRRTAGYPPPIAPEPSEVNPYAPPTTLGTPVISGPRPVAARRLTRLAAHILDVILLVGAVLPGALLMSSESLMPVGPAIMLLGLLAIVVYNFVLLHRQGQTLGKRTLRIRILRSDAGRASLGRIILLRALVPGLIGVIPGLGALFGLLDALWIFGVESRCIHDYIADTVVVQT